MRTIIIIAFVLLALNCFAAAPGDGWFFGWSNGAPAWIINGGLVTNVNLTSATNEALLIGLNGTNNSISVSNNLQTAITNEALLIGSNATNESTRVSNNATNQSLKIGGNDTNEVARVAVLCTNESLLIGSNATNESTRISNNATNEALLIGSGATNEALLIGANDTNNDSVVSQNATNQSAVVSNALFALVDKRVLTNDTRVLSLAGPIFDTNITASRMVFASSANQLTAAAASGAVPIDADGSASTAAQITALYPTYVVTNQNANVLVLSNALKIDPAHALSLSNLTTGHVIQVGADSTISSVSSGTVPIDGDGSATTFSQVQALAPSVILTNGGTTAVTYSNAFRLDVQHALSLSNLTTSHVLQVGADSTVSSVSSGAVPIDGNGAATTFPQIQALASSVILTNGNLNDVTMSNAFRIDAQHALSLSNLTTGHVLQVGADSTVSSVSSGAVPINGDGTATTAAQLLAIAGSKTLWSANTGNVGIPASTTIFFPLNNCTSNLLVFTSDASGGTRSLMASQTTFKNMRVIASVNPGTSKCTITLMTNGTASNLTCGPSGGTTASDTTDTVLCLAGTEVGWKMVIAASATTAKYEIAAESDQ